MGKEDGKKERGGVGIWEIQKTRKGLFRNKVKVELIFSNLPSTSNIFSKKDFFYVQI